MTIVVTAVVNKLAFGQERALETSPGEYLEKSTSIGRDSDVGQTLGGKRKPDVAPNECKTLSRKIHLI